MRTLVIAIGLLVAVPGMMVAAHYTLLTVAALFFRESSTGRSTLRLLVLVPAHNEEAVLPRTLVALKATLRPGDLVLVVDDRSTDSTGEIATAHGALVLRREPGETPGRAAARQDGIRRALELEWDAIVFIDADSVVEPGFMDAVASALATGASVVQARGESLPGPGLLAQAQLAAFALQGITIPRGRDRLGLSVRLKGTGMALRRHLLDKYSFRGPGAGEDLWFSNDLCLDGIVARHVDSARLRSESTRNFRAARGQRVRYEAGRMIAAREFLGPLVRRGSPACLEAAWHLLTVPFALAILSLVAGAAVLVLDGAGPAATVVLLSLLLLGLDLIIAMVLGRVPRATWLALVVAPVYMAWKAWVQVEAMIAVARRKRDFAATPRD